MDFYLVDDYYFDYDSTLNQFRLSGPENHLLLGFTVLNGGPAQIADHYLEDTSLVVRMKFPESKVTLSQPLVADIRTLRQHTEGARIPPTFHQLELERIADLRPHTVQRVDTDERSITFLRWYTDESQQQKFYGSELRVAEDVAVDFQPHHITLEAPYPLLVTITTKTNISSPFRFEGEVVTQPQTLDNTSPALRSMYFQSASHLSQLIQAKRTSSFEYGTVFPRDWIETLHLGKSHLTMPARDFVMEQAMKHVSETGEAWHEEAIGEFQYKVSPQYVVDRKMIDIEPLMILSAPLLSRNYLHKPEVHQKFQAIAQYVLDIARHYDVVWFKKSEEGSYYPVGNWRDSLAAFAQMDPPIAPYDVNCVFYPQALRILQEMIDYFDLPSDEELSLLRERWLQHQDRYRIVFADGVSGYSLALTGAELSPLPIAHLDESYALFYGQPTKEDVIHFAEKMLSDEYFYTPGGPLLVGANTEQLDETHYHGKVIWPKQAAFAVGGLARQYRYGQSHYWPEPMMGTIRQAIIQTAEACMTAWEQIEAVPELYYYDRHHQRAKFYTDQPEVEGQMSFVQLWSAAACLRIISTYERFVSEQ